jgi:hypothetical protein
MSRICLVSVAPLLPLGYYSPSFWFFAVILALFGILCLRTELGDRQNSDWA